MKIEKSSRHSKIAGDFGESLFLYWLSKIGFEIAFVDHTGIDLVTYHKVRDIRYGISVKTRTRLKGTENEGIYIKPSEIKKIKNACKYFGFKQFIGIVVDRNNTIDAILLSLQDMIAINGIGKVHINIKVSSNYMKRYKELENSMVICMHYKTINNF